MHNPHSTTPHHETEPEKPSPITAVTVSAWALDPKRRRLYGQIAFVLAAVVVAVVVLYLLRDFLGAFVLGAAISFLIQPAVARLDAAGVPRMLAIGILFIVIIIILAGLVLLIVPLGVKEVAQLQRQAPTLAAEAQKQLNMLQGSPIQFVGISIDLKSITDSINSHLKDYLLGQAGNAVTIGLTALTTLPQ